jgi:hypothetical protein
MKPARYTTAKRAAEFRQGRKDGLVTAATVRWHGEQDGETLDWSTFLPGSLHQPLPVLFAPLTNFARHGGPDAFGLSRLGDHDLSVPSQPLRTLVAQISRTDIDLFDPAEAPPLNWIGGVHYDQGVDPSWRQAALSCGQALLLTGAAMPTGPGPHPQRSLKQIEDLWAAVIPVHAA